MDKLKYVKIEDEKGNLSDSIPIGADAVNIDLKDNSNVEDAINNINKNISNLDNDTKEEVLNLKNTDEAIKKEIESNKENINTQKTRIDNLAKLQEGSTTGDAELIDGRIGYDNKTYNTIGDAIRNQNRFEYGFLATEKGYINYDDGKIKFDAGDG